MSEEFDAIVTGAGPAGSACALALARDGHRVLVVERENFPREKVCGDCLNPSCWPVFASLGVETLVRALPGVDVTAVEFESVDGRLLRTVLPESARGPRAVRRSILDAALAAAAGAAGAELRHGAAVQAVRRSAAGWEIDVGGETLRARVLIAADGRNSSTVRLATGSGPREREASRDARIGLHAHLPRTVFRNATVRMFWRPEGYGGIAPVDADHINVAIAVRADGVDSIKRWVEERFANGESASWRAMAPLERRPADPAQDGGLFLAGDAARIVEPFTGEGIYYALATGAMIGAEVSAFLHGAVPLRVAAAGVRRRHAALYRGRLWWNALARWFGCHPQAARWMLRWSQARPALLGALTRKVSAR